MYIEVQWEKTASFKKCFNNSNFNKWHFYIFKCKWWGPTHCISINCTLQTFSISFIYIRTGHLRDTEWYMSASYLLQ